jgi:ATP-dependent Lon protease
MSVIRNYTREAGVRSLKREISKLMRKAVRDILTKKVTKVLLDKALIEDYLGPAFYRHDKIDAEAQVGVVTGLAWTPVGGEILTIEGVMTHGKGRMTVTGNLKEVMKESITAASGYVRSRATDLGVKPPLFDQRDIHLHVPEGATPKDGPSAGIAMATAIVSLMTGIPIRHDVAMTGEVTLRGRVLPIGGLKEKLLAALRSGIKTVLIPEENVRDLKEIPEIVTKGLEIIPVARMDQVLKAALTRMPEPIEWTYEEKAPAAAPPATDGEEPAGLPH